MGKYKGIALLVLLILVVMAVVFRWPKAKNVIMGAPPATT